MLRRLLAPLFESRFHPDSFGFRPERNCHQAIERILELWRQGDSHVLDADIQGFFDNLPHPVIKQGLSAVVADANIQNGVFKPTSVGTPQGGVTSPLLTNIALDSLDWFLDKQGLRFVRYADDFVVVCRSETQAKEALIEVRRHLSDQLGSGGAAQRLTGHPGKIVKIDPLAATGREWLRPLPYPLSS